jgi:hypothetical protein
MTARSAARSLRLLLLVALIGGAGGLEAQDSGGASTPAAVPAPSIGSQYLLLEQQIREAEGFLADRILGAAGSIGPQDVQRLSALAETARVSLYGDLIDRSALLLVLAEEALALEQHAASRATRLEEILRSRELEAQAELARRRRTAALSSSLGATAAAFATAFTFWYLSEWQDQQNFQATSIDDAVRHRRNFKLFSWVSCLAAGAGRSSPPAADS